jgi:hypothetical protein
MNEFEKKAWEYVDGTWDWTNPDKPSKATLFKKKFAELNVKECAELFPLSGRPLSGGAIQCTIKEHFGIE